jgi:uncharacterized short protein YbdD (DUF466 family)
VAGTGGEVAPGQAPGRRYAIRSVRPGLRRLLAALRQIVGAPDYERYVAHCAERHPGRAPLSPRAYYAEFVTRRFGGGGPARCC